MSKEGRLSHRRQSRTRPAYCAWGTHSAAFSLPRCARTGVAPLTGSTVGGKGSVRVPSAATFRGWKAFAAGVAEAPDCSLETQIQLSEWSITVENAAPAVLAITKCWMDLVQRIGQVIDGDRVVAGIGGVKAAACMIDDAPSRSQRLSQAQPAQIKADHCRHSCKQPPHSPV